VNNERNCLSYWFPILQAAGAPVPETRILKLSDDDGWALVEVLDGKTPEPLARVVTFIEESAAELGLPMFLRTGQGSGKHEWDCCCNVTGKLSFAQHVASLIEWSHCVDFIGLPHNVWVCRKMLAVEPLFRCTRYGGMPVVREWRYFVRDGSVLCVHPYWPADALVHGKPDRAMVPQDVRWLHADPPDRADTLAGIVADAFKADGYWSVDVLEAVGETYYVTDMADGEASFHWPACPRQLELVTP